MDNPSHSTVSLSSLLCQETETCLDDEDEDDPFFGFMNYASSASDSSEDEYIRILLQRESALAKTQSPDSALVEGCNRSGRLDAVDYILSTRALFGFHFQTAYLSVLYFDRFLSKRSIDREKRWAIELLSVACVSLAAKLEECRVPDLSELQDGDCNFEGKIIQRMELLVLNTLEWKMVSVTPFAFLPYLVNKFCNESPPEGIVSSAVELILAVIRDVNLMDHQPSAIASAAVLVTLDQRLTRKALEWKINAIPSSRFLDIEDVFTCYTIMQRLELAKIRMPKLIVSPGNSQIKLRSIEALRNASSANSSISTKRKRLTYSDNDQNYDLPEKKRHK